MPPACEKEADALIRCAQRPTSDGCATAFVAMRECNRGSVEMKFGPSSMEMLSSALYDVASAPRPPARSSGNLAAAADAYAKKLQITEGAAGVRF
ncbi:unnamed protein product [Amoebophrya sp. A25]|nr:unnamed protein product [Amoebophrya sp. A25]|eukprot:GSA25T00010710001.1